jgi:hypothetical protein
MFRVAGKRPFRFFRGIAISVYRVAVARFLRAPARFL